MGKFKRVKGNGIPILTYHTPEMRFAIICVKYKIFTKNIVREKHILSYYVCHGMFLICMKYVSHTSVYLNLTLVEHNLFEGGSVCARLCHMSIY